VYKSRDRFEQDCLKIKGYLAQGHMVMGQEERKNKAKLEKTQIQMSSNSNEYEAAVKVLEETTGKWNREWKAGCDKFQDLEEERLDFFKSSLWSFANIASTVCVSDDALAKRFGCRWKTAMWKRTSPSSSKILVPVKRSQTHEIHQFLPRRYRRQCFRTRI